MTVIELIEKLKPLPAEARVYLDMIPDEFVARPVLEVETEADGMVYLR